MTVYDRWHKSRPKPDDLKCSEHKKALTSEHGVGERWQVRWRDDAGQQRKKNFERKVDADRFDARIHAELAAGTYVDPDAGKITLKEYGDKWLAAQTFEESTRESVELRLRLHVYPTLGGRELRALRPSVIQSWTRGLQQTLAPNYVRTVFANLSGLLAAAVDDGLIAKNPCRAGSVKPPAPSRKKIRPWSRERVEAVRSAIPVRYCSTVDLGAGLGLRQGEVFGLAVDDVEFLPGVVHVVRQVKIVGAKLCFAPPKGGKPRDVPLPESVALRLAGHVTAYSSVSVTLPWKHPEGKLVTARLIFTSRERKALNRNYFNTFIWKPALETAGVIPQRLEGVRKWAESREHGFHALRHHFASVLLADGVDVRSLAEFLGHHDPGFTLRTYTHLMPSGEERMRKAVDRALNGHLANGLSEASALDVP
ncbi:tyrosine-type recombinase/integrase [Streptosporangium sp. NPDC006007]|uniref:tyrosine-type recombinase/integrase n=1 Tax=Streptosporangium sp. NPDC006007 TaxID=3154575 RepID=UPI0033A10F69